MLDLTQEISLDPRSYKKYRYFQVAIYLLAVFLAVYLGYLIAFPAKNFVFYPATPDSAKSNVVSSKIIPGHITQNGKDLPVNNTYFDAVLPGNYSQIQIDLTLKNKSSLPSFSNVQVRKSFQVFFYPEGNYLGFNDGTLVKSGASYFLVSDGKLRRFSNESVSNRMGYKKEAFVEAQSDDLKHNEKGDDITDINNYPNGSIFKINDEYYILKDQKFQKFVSAKAYLTQYNDNQAIDKDADFLNKYPADDNLLGFADGTLISYGESAFVISSGRILPIDNPNTFLSKGYQWSDIIPVSGDELSLYQRDKLFNISSPHPNGTIIENSAKNEIFLIKDGQKYPLSSQLIAQSWSKNNPVTISQDSATPIGNCQPKKDFWDLGSTDITCVIPIDNSQNLIGTDYELKLTSDSDTKIDTVSVTFEKTVNKNNLKSSISNLISKIKGNYASQIPTSAQ